MASAASSATRYTTLVVGRVEVPVGLFSTVAKPSPLADFDTAGPNGGVLKARPVARPVPVDEPPAEVAEVPEHSDPLADPREWPREPSGPMLDPSKCGPPQAVEVAFKSGVEVPDVRPVDGEYGRELVEEGTGVVVEQKDVRRGVRLEDGRFIDCTEQLAEIAERTRLESMEIVGFVDVTQISRAWVKAAQYIGAGSPDAPRALRMIFEGLKLTRRGAVVKVTKRSRQTLGVIVPWREVLVLTELVWSEDWREPPAQATAIHDADPHRVDAFVQLIDAMSGPVGMLLDQRDDAIALREELKARAVAGELPESAEVETRVVGPEDEILAQLEASLAAAGRG